MFYQIKKEEQQEKYSQSVKELLKVPIFLLIGVLLFCILQYIFTPKRFPYIKEYDAGKRYFYNEEENSIDIIIAGTSHSGKGILPMDLYEKYGIKSYNLATSTQPIEATYYLLQESLKTQNPKVFILDVSNVYLDEQDSRFWKYVIDEMKIGKNRVLLIQEYLKHFEDTGETTAVMLFPLLEYHTRWKELERQDFIFFGNKHYYGKGTECVTLVRGCNISVDKMNAWTDELLQNTEQELYEYSNGEFSETHEENVFYSVDIPESNIDWLVKIKNLCDQNNIQLLTVKVPSVYTPQEYASAWPVEKSEKMHALCGELGIAYYDLLYDTDLNLDYKKDFPDGGKHLNFYGAQKASDNLGNYLKENYELSDEHNEQWDRDLVSYQKLQKVASLELEQDFVTYINMLADEYKDNTIFITVSDDMSKGLNEADINALRTLGLQADYSKTSHYSYIAVIENGEVRYEALSNRQLNYSGVCNKSGKKYELYSSGWWTNMWASIKLDETEYAVNRRGLNIVVYDDERGLVLDSVGFDTHVEDHTPLRTNAMINSFEEEFEHYIMEVEDK